MKGITLDAGALIALERGDRRVVGWLGEALREGIEIAIPAGALGQVFRDGSRQVRLARLILSDAVSIEPLDGEVAKRAGVLCGIRGTSDVIDASVVLCARAKKHVIATSDPTDLKRLDPSASLLIV